MSTHARMALTEHETEQLNRALEAAGIYLLIESQDGRVVLTGEVDSVAMRDAAIDVAEAIAIPRGLQIEDAIDVLDHSYSFGVETRPGGLAQDQKSAEASTESDLGTMDADEAAEEGIPYFPPTDPVIRAATTETGDPEIIGGFQSTSMQEEDSNPNVLLGDDAITEDVIRELREDAATTDLVITVHTRNGVVTLVGEVPTLDDAEGAEAVASRVSGVVEVREDLTVRSMLTEQRR